MSYQPVALVWLRHDLRLSDNPALHAAVLRARENGGGVLPVYIMEEPPTFSPPGWASRWWLGESLKRLSERFQRAGAPLLVCRGAPHVVLPSLMREMGGGAVYWNRRYDPAGMAVDRIVADVLRAQSVPVETFNAAVLFEPGSILTKGGTPFQVFTPFWRACCAHLEEVPLPAPLGAPAAIPGVHPTPESETVEALFPAGDDHRRLATFWQPGEEAAYERLRRFMIRDMADYEEVRDHPDLERTSGLAASLHFGEISPRQILTAVREENAQGAEAFVRQIVWREFSHHLLFHFPRMSTEPMRQEFASFPWRDDPRALEAWQHGKTGFPIVDAAMRCLRATGGMHNRARMIVASFLVKHLLIPWQQGQAWFWENLVDADCANNAMGWQWVSGCGADGAPYFRIFNPVLQGEKFDKQGRFVRRWVPELQGMPDRFIHRPWDAPMDVLALANVWPGKNYPLPIIDHAVARARALSAYEEIMRKRHEGG